MKAVEGFKYCKVCGDMFFEEDVYVGGKCARCGENSLLVKGGV